MHTQYKQLLRILTPLCVFLLWQWKHQFMAQMCIALIKPLRLQKLFCTWILPPACEETGAQVKKTVPCHQTNCTSVCLSKHHY